MRRPPRRKHRECTELLGGGEGGVSGGAASGPLGGLVRGLDFDSSRCTQEPPKDTKQGATRAGFTFCSSPLWDASPDALAKGRALD